MSMLAQGRRKQKISTNPNGLHFSNDESNIGQKLMSQMGWEKGRGLGANEQGNKDPIKVKMNMENRGLGCKRSDVDKWIAHQDDFNSLLANLNENTEADELETQEGSDSKPEQSFDSQSNESKCAVQSLEAKSKSSRSRVHYMKFTKGKDLSRHSQKDLACILGPSRSGNCTPTPQTKTSSAVNSDNDSNPDSADPFLSDALHVTSTLSLQEYFASKMAAKKSSSSNLLAEMAVSTDPDTGDETAEDIVKPSFFIGDTAAQEDEEQEETSSQHKQRKRSKNKHKLETVEVENVELYKKKKKKKRKEERREARHSTGGKTKPKPADDTMKFVSESSEDEQSLDNKVEKSQATSREAGTKRKHSAEETTADSTAAGKIKKSKSDSQLVQGSGSSESKSERKKHKKKSRDDS